MNRFVAQAVWTVAANTFREAVRGRLLILCAAFAAVLFGGTGVISLMAVGNGDVVLLDLGLAALSIVSILTTIALGVTLIYKEVQLKTLYLILARPVPRGAFLVGRYLGTLMAVSLLLWLMFLLFAGTVILWPNVHFSWNLALPVVMLNLELALLTAVSVCFSAMSSPLVGTIFVTGFTLIGHCLWSLRDALVPYLHAPGSRKAALFLFQILPDFEQYNIRHLAAHNLPIAPGMLGSAALYTVVYVTFFLVLADTVFRRRDLT